MIRAVAFLLLWAAVAGGMTLDALRDKPDGRAKNFLLWHYLQQDVTPQEADAAFSMMSEVDTRLFRSYAHRSKRPEDRETLRCLDLRADRLLDEPSDDCSLLALTPSKVASLSAVQRRQLAVRFADSPDAKWLDFLATATASNLERFDPALFVRVASRAGQAYRRLMLDRDYSIGFIDAISKQKGFDRLVKLVVTDPKMERFQRALLEADNPAIGAQGIFFLALNRLRFDHKKEALAFLERAQAKFYFRMDKDKALFWQFLVSEDPVYLRQLAQSVDINVYSLYASEKMGMPMQNYFTTLPTKGGTSRSIDDPFVWKAILEEVKQTPKEKMFDLAARFRAPGMEPVQAFILERAYGYRMHGYITPYQDHMGAMKTDKRAIMLSLMRQESHFIPSALSRSYALGLMQMMPFLVKAMDKGAKRPVGSLTKMFDPETNIAYASKHLDHLQHSFYNPLFIAYAYNGGGGFTKRHLLGGAFSKGPYEPFWSMEMMANSESREYGKKVLANYVMYKRIFGEEVSIARLFDNLLHPSRSDRYRAQAAEAPASEAGM